MALFVLAVFALTAAIATGCHAAPHKAKPLAERAQFSFQPFELSDVVLACSRTNASSLFSCKLQFDWSDPNSVKENTVTSCSCAYSWQWDGVAAASGINNTFDNVNFHVCTNNVTSIFEMRVNSFTDPSNLTLFMSHYYKDSSLWGPPYLFARTWAAPTLNLTHERLEVQSMAFYAAGPVTANITGLDD